VPDRFIDADTLIVGVLADTHLPYRLKSLPNEVFEIFGNADLILHAGDVDRIEYLSELAAMAPLYAVRGNPHFTDFSDGGRNLPLDLRLTLAGRGVVVNHGGWPGFWSKAGDWTLRTLLRRQKPWFNRHIAARLARLYPHADVVIFGHTHRPYQTWLDGTLMFNPGAVCPTRGESPSVGRLFLTPDRLEAEIIPLARRETVNR
jgi:predicted phosphodiesterase